MSLSLCVCPVDGVFTLVFSEMCPRWTCPLQCWVRESVCPSVCQLQPCRRCLILMEKRPRREVRHTSHQLFNTLSITTHKPHGGAVCLLHKPLCSHFNIPRQNLPTANKLDCSDTVLVFLKLNTKQYTSNYSKNVNVRFGRKSA